MSDQDKLEVLKDLMKKTARAHHEATGGVNPEWAEWYAEHMIEELKRLSNKLITVDELSSWLAEADRRYQAESPGMSWPRAYATWFLESD